MQELYKDYIRISEEIARTEPTSDCAAPRPLSIAGDSDWLEYN